MTTAHPPRDVAFWDRVARKYAARPIGDTANYERTLARVRAHLAPGDRILEIGCGTSSTALLLAPDVAHVTASDISAEMVAIGREKIAAAGVGNVTVVQGTPGDAALGSGPYDAVLAFNLLHLTRDPGDVSRKVRALLKPGGLFISKSACLGNRLWVLWPALAAMRLIGKAPYVNVFTAAGLERRIADAGFEIIETGNYTSRFIVARKI